MRCLLVLLLLLLLAVMVVVVSMGAVRRLAAGDRDDRAGRFSEQLSSASRCSICDWTALRASDVSEEEEGEEAVVSPAAASPFPST